MKQINQKYADCIFHNQRQTFICEALVEKDCLKTGKCRFYKSNKEYFINVKAKRVDRLPKARS